jgi:hypothetical protein
VKPRWRASLGKFQINWQKLFQGTLTIAINKHKCKNTLSQNKNSIAYRQNKSYQNFVTKYSTFKNYVTF